MHACMSVFVCVCRSSGKQEWQPADKIRVAKPIQPAIAQQDAGEISASKDAIGPVTQDSSCIGDQAQDLRHSRILNAW